MACSSKLAVMTKNLDTLDFLIELHELCATSLLADDEFYCLK